jgi:formate--tetrahydrofolate ligase
MKSDLDIARETKLKPIDEIAQSLGLCKDHLRHYGKYIAKVEHEHFPEIPKEPKGKLILVSAITPTPAGEGKTTISVGLSLA